MSLNIRKTLSNFSRRAVAFLTGREPCRVVENAAIPIYESRSFRSPDDAIAELKRGARDEPLLHPAGTRYDIQVATLSGFRTVYYARIDVLRRLRLSIPEGEL